MTFFRPQKEEALASIVCRWALVSGYGHIGKLLQPFVYYPKGTINIFPRANAELSEALSDIFSNYSLDAYVKYNSLIPLYNLSSSEDLAAIHISDLVDKKKRPYANAVNKILDRDEHTSQSVRFCSECFREQVSRYGFRWIKREWLIEVSSTCLKHNIPLSQPICRACDLKSKPTKALMASISGMCDECNLRIAHSPVKPHKYCSYAGMASHLLASNYGVISSELLIYLLRECALRIGLSASLNFSGIKHALLKVILRDDFIPYSSYEWKNTSIFNTHKTFQYKFKNKLENTKFPRYPVSCIYFPLGLAFNKFSDLDDTISAVSIRNTDSNRNRLELKEEYMFLGEPIYHPWKWGVSYHISSSLNANA